MSGYLHFYAKHEALGAIASALEDAGNAFHHTSEWQGNADMFDGKTPHELVQATFEAADAEIDRLRRAISDGVPKWIPVSERLPELTAKNPRVDVIAAWDGGVAEMAYAHFPEARTERGRAPRWEWFGRIAPWTITHWMPLPEAPNAHR